MTFEQHYEEIPFNLLTRAGFPTNSVWLNDEQRSLLEYIFNERYKLLEIKLDGSYKYIHDLEDEQRYLEDRVADLQHELKDLAGEK